MDTKNKNKLRLSFSLSHFLTFSPAPLHTGSPAHRPPCTGFSLIEVLVVISLMALLAVYLGAKTGEVVTQDKFYKTCYMMEEIKEAIIGKPGHYCNGVQQFTGYVSDMGNLPNLYYFDDDKKEFVQVTHAESGKVEATEGEGGASLLAEALKQGHRPQPNALWSKSIGGLPEWKYHDDAQLWAGWRGPYIDPPPSGALRDAWGKAFLFVIGEVVGHEEKTYRCKESYTARIRNPLGPGSDKWEVIDEDEAMNFRIWQDVGTEDVPYESKTKQEKFYGDSCLTIISLGADNKPDGEGLDKDISIVIDPTEYVGEVAGHVGNRHELFADKVCLYYPNYTEEGGDIEELCIPESGKMQVNSQLLEYEARTEDGFAPGELYTGINFRFGTGNQLEYVARYQCYGGTGEFCDGAAADPENGCVCEEYRDICIEYNCKCEGNEGKCCKGLRKSKCADPLDRDPCVCTRYGTSSHCKNTSYGDICVEATCSEMPSDCTGYFNCDCCDTRKYCYTWKCDKDIGAGVQGCSCTPFTDTKIAADPKNRVAKDIPIGIRTIKADSGPYYMFSVCAGGNWVGTVRSEH